jgi:hypothetical protein
LACANNFWALDFTSKLTILAVAGRPDGFDADQVGLASVPCCETPTARAVLCKKSWRTP